MFFFKQKTAYDVRSSDWSSDVCSSDLHRIALLVPVTGKNAAVGKSIANAANMALLDTGAKNLRVTTYDTAANPGDAARRALADGNQLILGPLLTAAERRGGQGWVSLC